MYECKSLIKLGVSKSKQPYKIYRYEQAYSVNEFDVKLLKARPLRRSKYIRLPMTFDIETSKIEHTDGTHEAFMYIWQCCIEGYVIFGRTWVEFINFLEDLRLHYNLHNERKLVIYVHNLSYEFQFLYRFIDFSDVFSMDAHAVLTAKNDYFEFRCSYKLSNMNLEKLTQDTPNVTHIKAVDDLDYSILRTPSTVMNATELGYCYNDVKGLYEVLLEYLKSDTLKSIKLTSTGFVRRDCRLAMRKNPKNRERFQKSKLTLKQYELLKECFRGGNTASNRYHTNMILEDVGSWDISSSYPFVMLAFKYPTGPFTKYDIESTDQLEQYNNKYCTIGRYRFYNLRLKSDVNMPYLTYNKCYDLLGVKPVNVYNGRILEAKELTTSITNIDYEIIKSQYDYDEVLVYDFYFAQKDYINNELKDVIFKYFEQKSLLKGVEGKEYEYIKAKNKLNAIYGMTVTDILHTKVEFKDGDFIVQSMDQDEKQKQLDKYYKSKNSFLDFQVGVFVTAYARRQLQKGLDAVGIDAVYCDTDSVKYLFNHNDDFKAINDDIRAYCKANNIKHTVNVNGKIYELGTYDYEGQYQEFKTLGAKKYAFTKDNKIGVTVAGLNKKLGAKEITRSGGLKAFAIGKVFNTSGRTTAEYNNDEIHVINVNGEDILTASNVAIVDCAYTLGITDTMQEILNNLV